MCFIFVWGGGKHSEYDFIRVKLLEKTEFSFFFFKFIMVINEII